ncbi:MAG: pyrophosphatase PpaX [Turicibacter sp.]
MIKAVFFDLDGTLIDTNKLIIDSFRHTFKTYFPERHFLDTEIYDCIGPTLTQTFTLHNPDAVEEMTDTYRTYNKEKHDEMVEIYPGILEMLTALKSMNLKLAIVTSKKRDMAIHGAELTKIYEYFDFVVSSDEVSEPKPHPEAIQLALKHFGLTPEEVIMVGDNSHDMECAKNASVTSVGVGWALRGADYLKSYGADYIIEEALELVKIVNDINKLG